MVHDALFEIGLEEIPARFIDIAEKNLRKKTETWLTESRLSFSSVTSYSTPRRLAVIIHDLHDEQAELKEELKGPSLKIAQDADGNWTKAAIGFTKGQGKTVEDLYTKEINNQMYVFINKHIEGKTTADILPDFKSIIEGMTFPETMHWGAESLRYVRPIRWITALYGATVIPLTIANVTSGRETRGHRFLGTTFELKTATDYEERLKENYVIVNAFEREKMIENGIKQLEDDEQVIVPIAGDLLQEVRNLVEYPTVFMGRFDQAFLQLPSEVLITSMKEHQRYFPVKSKDETLLPCFVGVRNGNEQGIDTVARGNEKVLKARLSDAQFFYEEDQNQPLDYYMEKLKKVVFQEKLGTIYDKVNRMIRMTQQLSVALNLDEIQQKQAVRAAELAKFDLVTNMVNEFTELQGIMGEKYAVSFGEDKAVATAIREHYLPRNADDDLPITTPGAIVSIADKLDTIVGCISAGLMPTGSQDPYGLRRKAIGILKTIEVNKWDLRVEALLDMAINTMDASGALQIDTKAKENIQVFMATRASFLLKEASIEPDIVQAVLANEIGVLAYTQNKALILSEKRQQSEFKSTAEAFTRVINMTNQETDTSEQVKPEYLETPSEKALYEKYEAFLPAYEATKRALDSKGALEHLEDLATYIHTFFEHNMVMVDDPDLRHNRLALLQVVSQSINDYADMTKISWKQSF